MGRIHVCFLYCLLVTIRELVGSFSTISLEVQKHKPPDPLEYDTVLDTGTKMYVIFQVGQNIVPFRPKTNTQNNSLFSVVTELPVGLSLDKRTGVITGTPEVLLSKTSFTVTATNMRGSQSTKICVEVREHKYAWKSEHTMGMRVTAERVPEGFSDDVEDNEGFSVDVEDMSSENLSDTLSAVTLMRRAPFLPSLSRGLPTANPKGLTNEMILQWCKRADPTNRQSRATP